MPKDGPTSMRRTMIKPAVGQVRLTSYDLPDARNPGHVYGYEVKRDPEGAGAVISKWMESTPSPAAQSSRSFVETNRQAIISGCITAGDTRVFAREHPEILVKPSAKCKGGYAPTNETIYGIKSKPSEDVNALIQARYTDFTGDNSEYPDMSNMKIKGKLPHPRETKASLGKDLRLQPQPVFRHPDDLFKMSKFKNVGAVLCTQPNGRAAIDDNDI